MASLKYKKRDWPAVYQAWQESGMSKVAFCRLNGVPESSFSAAVAKGRHLPSGSEEFVKATLSQHADDSGSDDLGRCVIEGPGGLRVLFESMRPDSLIALLRRGGACVR